MKIIWPPPRNLEGAGPRVSILLNVLFVGGVLVHANAESMLAYAYALASILGGVALLVHDYQKRARAAADRGA